MTFGRAWIGFRKLLGLKNNADLSLEHAGETKCVPLNVERKLWSTSLFARFVPLRRTIKRTFSLRSKLLDPTLSPRR
jgi:hypothetical protein